MSEADIRSSSTEGSPRSNTLESPEGIIEGKSAPTRMAGLKDWLKVQRPPRSSVVGDDHTSALEGAPTFEELRREAVRQVSEPIPVAQQVTPSPPAAQATPLSLASAQIVPTGNRTAHSATVWDWRDAVRAGGAVAPPPQSKPTHVPPPVTVAHSAPSAPLAHSGQNASREPRPTVYDKLPTPASKPAASKPVTPNNTLRSSPATDMSENDGDNYKTVFSVIPTLPQRAMAAGQAAGTAPAGANATFPITNTGSGHATLTGSGEYMSALPVSPYIKPSPPTNTGTGYMRPVSPGVRPVSPGLATAVNAAFTTARPSHTG